MYTLTKEQITEILSYLGNQPFNFANPLIVFFTNLVKEEDEAKKETETKSKK